MAIIAHGHLISSYPMPPMPPIHGWLAADPRHTLLGQREAGVSSSSFIFFFKNISLNSLPLLSHQNIIFNNVNPKLKTNTLIPFSDLNGSQSNLSSSRRSILHTSCHASSPPSHYSNSNPPSYFLPTLPSFPSPSHIITPFFSNKRGSSWPTQS